MPKTTILLVPLIAACLLPASGRASDPEPPEWRVPAVTTVQVDLPQVVGAERDAPLRPAERFVGTLTAEGRLHFGSAVRYVAGHGDLGTGALSLDDGRKTHLALRAWSRGLKAAARAAGLGGEGGPSTLRVLLRADRRRPWIEALWLIETASSEVGVTHLQLAVDKTGAADGSWQLPYDVPLGIGTSGSRPSIRHARLALGVGSDGLPLLQVDETSAPGGTPQLKLATLVVPKDGALDVDALARTLRELGKAKDRERKSTLLVTTLVLEGEAARTWHVGDVVPVLATLRGLGAHVLLQSAPIAVQPPPAEALREGGRAPFAAPPTRISKRLERWEKAIDEALKWLQAHQSPSGQWEAAGFGAWYEGERLSGTGPEGAGLAEHDVGVTGLALQAFLGAGYAPRGEHPYVETVRRGLRWLLRAQDDEGCYGSREGLHWIYDHGAAAWAMVEAAGLTEDVAYRASAQRALDFIAMARNPYFAWRYGVKPGDNDTSVTGWMLMPIALARTVNRSREGSPDGFAFRIDEAAFDGAKAWLDKMTDTDYGRTGYIQRGGSAARTQALIDRFPGDKSEAMTALAITLRVEIGENPTSSRIIAKGLDRLKRLPPEWNPNAGTIDPYYWYWGSLATWQAGRKHWRAWSEALDRQVRTNQRKDTTHRLYRGSWDPLGPWGAVGGRVYMTALMALTLETPTRYARRFGR